jgi:hypothetical protein
MINRLWASFLTDVVRYRGSTRAAALMRMGFILVIWRKFGGTMVLTTAAKDPSLLPFMLPFWVLTLMAFIGLYSKITVLGSGLLCLGMYFWFGIYHGITEPWIHHHTYLVSVLLTLLGLTDCGRSLSLDRWLAVKRAQREKHPIPSEEGSLWGLRLIAVQITAVYWFGAWDKTFPTYGERLEHMFLNYYWSSDYPTMAGFSALFAIAALITIVLEYWLPFGLFSSRQRPVAIVAGITLHTLFFLLLRVSTFSATMVLSYLAFVRPETIHRFIDDLMARDQPPPPSPTRPEDDSKPKVEAPPPPLAPLSA